MRTAFVSHRSGPARTVARQAFLLAVLGGAVAGCGESAPPAEPHPVDFMPAGAQVAIEAAVRPGGGLAGPTRSSLSTLGVSGETVQQLAAALDTPGGTVSYTAQVAPWLGERAGIFVTAGGRRERRLLDQTLGELLGERSKGPYPFAAGAAGAIVLDAKNRAAAQTFAQQRAAADGARAQDVAGAWYAEAPGGLAFAASGPIVLVGSSAAVKEALATKNGAPSLANSKEFKALAVHAPGDPLARAYAAPGAQGALPGQLRGAFSLVAGRSATLASLVPGNSSVSVYSEASGAERGSAAGAPAREAFVTLPGESWLAAGLGGGPQSLVGATTALGALGAGSGSSGSLLAALNQPLALLAAEPATWSGPVGLFAAGNGLLELHAAAVLRASSPESASRALTRLAGALGSQATATSVQYAERALAIHLHGLPIELVAATGTGLDGHADLIIGAGAASVELALRPPGTMLSSPASQAAKQALGGLEPTLVVDVPTLLGTLETLQAAGEPLLMGATPYLKKVTTIDAGIGSPAPGIGRWRLIATLHA